MIRKSKRFLAILLSGVLTAAVLSGCTSEKNIGGNVKLENGEIEENSIVIKVGELGSNTVKCLATAIC